MLIPVTLNLLQGLETTLKLFALTLLFALPLGLVISFGSMSRLAPLRYVVKTVVWVIRGTPLMIQILVIFYGPGLLFDCCPGLPRRWYPLSSTTPAISLRSTAAASSPFPKASRRPVWYWA